MLRTALLWGNTITLDADLSKYIETVSDQWVIEGLEVSSNSVAPGKAWVKATRSNGETIMTLVQNTEALSIDTSGTKKIWLEIRQEAIDNGLLNNEDWTWIAEIKTWPSVPSQNFLLLATVAENVVKDERNLIPKIQSIDQKTSVLEEKMESAEGQITQLVEAGTPSYLWITRIIGEKVENWTNFFLEKQPDYHNCDIAEDIWSSNENKFIHIQKIASGVKNNSIKLKIKKIWLPTVWLNIEIKRGVRVDVNGNEIYWYWWDTIMSSVIPHSKISSDYQELTITFPSSISFNQWEMVSVSLSQVWSIVNSLNYYQIACSNSSYSESSSCVLINSSWKKTRKKTIPYCISDSFVGEVFAKNSENLIEINKNIIFYKNAWPLLQSNDAIEFISKYTGVVNISFDRQSDTGRAYSSYWWLQVISNWEEVFRKEHISGSGFYPNSWTQTWAFNVNAWDAIRVKVLGWVAGICKVSNINMTMNTIKLSKKWFIFRSNKIPNVWEKMNCFFYWFVNWKLMNPVLLNETVDSVKTWSITLWNAVWFVKIHIWWKDFALPLYWI